MLGQESAQIGFFHLEMLGSLLDPIVPAGSFYARFARERGELFKDEDFAELYCLDNGRPSVPPSQLAALLLLQAHDGVSDREAIARATADLRWKYALGLAIDEVLCSRATVVHFRARLHLHDQGEKIFDRIMERAQERKVLKARGSKAKVVLDTTPVFGRGAVEDTYNLLAKGIKLLTRALARMSGSQPEEWATEHGLQRYWASSIKGQAEIDWSDADARRAFLAGIVGDADRLLELARMARSGLPSGDPTDANITEAAELLVSLLQQDIERRDDGPALRRGTARDRVVSVHDPEMRHGHKSANNLFQGHKAAIAAEPESGIITAVDVLPGNAPDSEGALELVEASEAATGLEVEEAIGDCAYGDAATRKEFSDAGRRIVAKVPQLRSAGVFSKDRFVLDVEAGTCTCPAGRMTTTLRSTGNEVDRKGNKHKRRTFVFPEESCAACSLRPQCTQARKTGRTIQVHPFEAELQAARRLQRSPEFAPYRQARQVVEHRNARLMQLGMRRSRYFGRAKTRQQLLMAASVANLTLILAAEDSNGGPIAAMRNAVDCAEATMSNLPSRLRHLFGCHLAAHPVGGVRV
jgi:transposase